MMPRYYPYCLTALNMHVFIISLQINCRASMHPAHPLQEIPTAPHFTFLTDATFRDARSLHICSVSVPHHSLHHVRDWKTALPPSWRTSTFAFVTLPCFCLCTGVYLCSTMLPDCHHPLFFWDMFCSWTWSSQILLVWLAISLQGFACLYPLHTGVIDVYLWGSGLRFPMFLPQMPSCLRPHPPLTQHHWDCSGVAGLCCVSSCFPLRGANGVLVCICRYLNNTEGTPSLGPRC